MTDSERIDHLGGPTCLAKTLGYTGKSAVSKVCNWRTRGIPARVKVQRPDLFLVDLPSTAKSQPEALRAA